MDKNSNSLTYLLFLGIFNKGLVESYLHTINAHWNMIEIPVAHYNVLLIALPLNCVISPCQAENLSSHDVNMLMLTGIIQYNGLFGCYHFISTEMEWLCHTVKCILVSLPVKKTGILCAMLTSF